MNRRRVGSYVIAGVSLVTAIIFIVAIPEHIVDPNWRAHARNHVFQALFWIVGFCLLIAIIALKPLQEGAEWARWAVALAGVFVYGGYFIPIPITGGGARGILDDIVFSLLIILFLVGLALVIWSDDPKPSS